MGVLFYCICGEGMGHATRSEVIIEKLIKKHEIVIFSYDRAYDYLKKRFENKVLDVVDIVGLNFVYENNQFMVGKSIINERKKFNKLITENFPKYIKYVVKYDPFLIITDYEIISSRLAWILKIPLISIDNMGFFTKGIVKKEFNKNWQVRFLRTIASISADYNFIVSLFKVPLRKKYKTNTYFIGPFIRKEIINMNPSKKNHILVYQTSKSNLNMFNVLKSSNEKYIIYGFDKENKEDNLTFKKNSVKGFVEDLASCKGVITNGGFSLICEAVYLKKPIYSIPVKNQIEQKINAYYLKKAGIAFTSSEINLTDLNEFISNLNYYEKNLKNFKIEPNNFDILTDKIKKILEYPTSKRTKMLKNLNMLEKYIKERLKKLTE